MPSNRRYRSSLRAICAAVLGLVSAPLFAAGPIEILSPKNGTLFRPGDTVTITVRTDRRYTSVDILTAAPLDVQVHSTEPNRFSFSLAADLPAGIYSFLAVGDQGLPDSSGFDDSERVEIDVEPVWSPSADGSRLVHDGPGVTVDTFGIPMHHRFAISYPPEALVRGIEGTVVVEITPRSECCSTLHVVSGPVELARHVIRCASTWRYAWAVGQIKPRRVSVTFSLAQANGSAPFNEVPQPQLADNLSYEFWVSGRSRSLRFKLTKLTILGLSDDETRDLAGRYNSAGLREAEEITFDQLQSIQFVTAHFDQDLHVYFMRDGGEISATIAPEGFLARGSSEEPVLRTMGVPPGVDPGWIVVSAQEQAEKDRISRWIPAARCLPQRSPLRVLASGFESLSAKMARWLALKPRAAIRFLRRAAEEAVKQWIYSPAIVYTYDLKYAVEVVTEAYPAMCPIE